MKHLAEELLRITDATEPRLRNISAAESEIPLRSGGWSGKQVLGHLIDSASNNHQRFVRSALQGALDFPGYDQEGCVRTQAPEAADWVLLISLWSAYNRYLAHVIERLPADRLNAPVRIGSGEPMTLEFVATDYVRHLLHHLRQIGVAD